MQAANRFYTNLTKFSLCTHKKRRTSKHAWKSNNFEQKNISINRDFRVRCVDISGLYDTSMYIVVNMKNMPNSMLNRFVDQTFILFSDFHFKTPYAHSQIIMMDVHHSDAIHIYILIASILWCTHPWYVFFFENFYTHFFHVQSFSLPFAAISLNNTFSNANNYGLNTCTFVNTFEMKV